MRVSLFISMLGIGLIGLPGAAAPRQETNCTISVHFRETDGQSFDRTYRLFRKTRAECERAASTHRINFNPTQISRKTVTFQWTRK